MTTPLTLDALYETLGQEGLSDHAIVKCRGCARVVTQCRCMKPNKTVYYIDVCDKCDDSNSGN